MKLSNNIDFFQKKDVQIEQPSTRPTLRQEYQQPQHRPSGRMQDRSQIIDLMKQTKDLLTQCGFAKLTSDIDQIQNDIARERFVISVVGEFNHGKSTFLNHLLNDGAMLPVGNLPTTAVLTRIRYAKAPQMVVFDEHGHRKATLTVEETSWKGLVADNFGNKEPKGSVIVGIPNPWVGKHGLELVDCPGAGDLSEERAQVIGDVLNRTDGAIITLNATAALSKNEKIFIQNRILSRQTPFTLIIVNKLDLVKKEERCQVIKYIKDKLANSKMDIPVFVPYDIEMPDETMSNLIGMDKVKKAIEAWTLNPERQHLIERWIRSRMSEVVNTAISSLTEQRKLLAIDDDKRLDIIAKKKQALRTLELQWNELSLELQAKSNACYSIFLKKSEEYTNDIIEKLQYESSHAGNPEKWWKEDYPYRLKVELANLSVGLENIVTKMVATDTKWFNDSLNQKFHTFVSVGNVSITDKDEYKATQSKRVLTFENLEKKQNIARVGTIALSLALAPFLGIVATMGVGTAGTLISSATFKKKIEEQRRLVKDAIAKDIPVLVMQATVNSEQRIQSLYDAIICNSDKQKMTWLETQSVAIEESNPSKVQKRLTDIERAISDFQTILTKIS